MSDLPPAAYTLEYSHTRSTGPVVGPFLTALRDGRILGIRCRGRVLAWTWIAEPARTHPCSEPFSSATILLDGADTALVHAVRAASMEEMATGMRVRAVFKPPAERDLGELDHRWGSTGEVLSRWEPTGEPDLPFEKIAEHNG